MKTRLEVFSDVIVAYNKDTGYLTIDDKDSGEQLAMYYVREED